MEDSKYKMMNTRNFKKILVAVSLGAESTTALKQALYFRKIFGSEITMLHVIPDGAGIKNVLQPKMSKGLQAKAMVRLMGFAKSHFRGRIPEGVNLRIESGNHVSVIKSIASSEGFDLIVINGSSRLEGFVGKFRKTGTRQIVSESICPVVVVKELWTSRGVSDILVPIDIAKKSRDLLKWAILLGKIFNANVKLLAAVTVRIELTKSLAYKKTQILKELIEREGVNCSVGIVEKDNGNRQDALLEGIRQIKADLLLVQGHQDLKFCDSPDECSPSELMDNLVRPVFSLTVKEQGFISDLLKGNKIRRTYTANRTIAGVN